MLPCKSPLHAHPNFYLLTLFHLLSPYYLSLVLLVLVLLVLVLLVLVRVLVLVLLSLYCLFPLSCPSLAPLSHLYRTFTVFFLVLYFAFSLLRVIIWIHGSGASTSKPKIQTTCFAG